MFLRMVDQDRIEPSISPSLFDSCLINRKFNVRKASSIDAFTARN